MLAPVMAVFVVAIFWKGMSRTAAVTALFLAFPLLTIVFLREFYGIWSEFNIFNLSAIIFVMCIAIIIIISYLSTAPNPEAVSATVWQPEMLRIPHDELQKGYPLWKHIGFWFIVLVICFSVIYAKYW